MKRRSTLKDYVIDVGALLSPDENNFCKMFFSGYPLRGINDFLLYFQAIPGQSTLIAVGIYRGKAIDHDVTGVIAFSDLNFVKAVFPDIDQTITIGSDTGVPMQCSNMIIAVPSDIPLNYIVKALQQPNRIHVFKDYHIPVPVDDPKEVITTDYEGSIPVNQSNQLNFEAVAQLPHVIHTQPKKGISLPLVGLAFSLLTLK